MTDAQITPIQINVDVTVSDNFQLDLEQFVSQYYCGTRQIGHVKQKHLQRKKCCKKAGQKS